MDVFLDRRARLPDWIDESFLSLLDAAPDAMLVVNQLGRIVVANPQAEKLFGYTCQQLASTSVETLIPERLRARHPEHRGMFFADPHVRPMGAGLELFAQRNDGTEFPVEISLSPLRIAEQQLVIAAIRDITRRQREEERFHGLMESAPDAMVIVDRSGAIARVNSQTEKLFQFARGDLLGKHVEMLIPERYRSKHTGHRTAFFSDPKARPMGVGLELFGLRRDGVEFPVEISLSPLKAEDGMYVTAAIRDITERKQAERQIQELNLELHRRVLELAASNRELEAFSYSVSHDLRAPLRQIAGFSQIMIQDAGNSLAPELLDYLREIDQGARHMGQLIDDLLSLSRLGRQALVRHVTDIAAIVRSVIAELDRTSQERQLKWSLGPLPATECDSALTTQIFRNLLSNAVKFTRTRSVARIEIGCEVHNHERVFFVRDNGVGFDMQYADKLFGVFQRLHLQDEFEGTGVGLATVQRIILKHGGRIWVHAELDRGATFFFTLERAPAEAWSSSSNA